MMTSEILSIALVSTSLALSADVDTVTTDLSVHWDETVPLANPHKGWYHHHYDNGLHKYLVESDEELTEFPGMDHLYLRFAWSYLEPKEGEFNWSVIDDMVEKWTKLGFGLSLRISCKETGTKPVEQQFATPRWVMEAGARGGYYRKGQEPGNPAFPWEPVFDDVVYLEKLENFIRVLAERYDGKPWLRYVDVGSLGDWGEGHTSSGSKIKYDWKARLKHLEIHTRHFKKSQLVVSDDLIRSPTPAGREKLHQYVLGHGISYRDDSILVDYWADRYAKTSSVANPAWFEAVYRSGPTILEMQHLKNWVANGSWEGREGTVAAKHGMNGADFMRGAIRQMRATYIGYHGTARQWMSLAGNPGISNELLNLCGYWYFPHHVTRPVALAPDVGNRITIGWENRGVAPAYHPYQVQFRLEGPGSAIITLGSGNLRWMPGKPGTVWKEDYEVRLPVGLEPGEYGLSFRLHSPQEDRPVLLPLAPGPEDGFWPVGKVRLR